MFDCIAGYHLNPWTCGIAKFNALLGQRVGVPVVSVGGLEHTRYQRPLLSLSLAEFLPPDLRELSRWLEATRGVFDVFLHAYEATLIERTLVHRAARVYGANRALAERLRSVRPESRALWCPGTLSPRPFAPAELSVFTFGMAHKIRVPLYGRLKDLLDATGKTYGVYVSTALHEHTRVDGEFVVTFDELQAIFADRVYFLGYLSDTAVYNHLRHATLLAAFFEPGLRANNTTVQAALDCGCAVVTNLDPYSPAGLVHLETILDIHQCERLPDPEEIGQIAIRARALIETRYGWDRLVAELARP